jgi:NAD(P)-dependent dehydrogenase (short-subunit alcohol dehydrogenase family)
MGFKGLKFMSITGERVRCIPRARESLAVYFPASDEASFITGQVLGVNGGLLI